MMRKRVVAFLAYALWAAATLTICDQIRLSVINVGFGSAFLLSTILLGYILCLVIKINPISREIIILLLFWVFSALLLWIGYLHSVKQGIMIPPNASYEIKSLLLSSIASTAVLAFFKNVSGINLKIYYIKVAIVFILPFSLVALLFNNFYGYHLWYGYIRLELFSKNPNLLGLYLIPLPFFILEEFRYLSTKLFHWKFIAVTLLISSIIWIGLQTLSDALKIAWLTTFLIWTIFILCENFYFGNLKNKKVFKLNLRKIFCLWVGYLLAYAANFLLAPLVSISQALLLLLPLNISSLSSPGSLPSASMPSNNSKSIEKHAVTGGQNLNNIRSPRLLPSASMPPNNSKSIEMNTSLRDLDAKPPVADFSTDVSYRSKLVINAMKAISLGGGLVGFGPGSFSGETSPFQGFDSHNTLIEWYLSTGLLGLALLMSLFGWVLFRLLLRKQYCYLMGMLALLAFSLAHNILNYPFFWIILSTLLLEPAHNRVIVVNQAPKK